MLQLTMPLVLSDIVRTPGHGACRRWGEHMRGRQLP